MESDCQACGQDIVGEHQEMKGSNSDKSCAAEHEALPNMLVFISGCRCCKIYLVGARTNGTTAQQATALVPGPLPTELATEASVARPLPIRGSVGSALARLPPAVAAQPPVVRSAGCVVPRPPRPVCPPGCPECVAAKAPEVSAKSAEAPDVSSKSAVASEGSAKSAEDPEVSAKSVAAPEVSRKSAPAMELSAKSAEPPVASALYTLAAELSMKSAEALEVSASSAAAPEVSGNSAAATEVSRKSAVTCQVSATCATSVGPLRLDVVDLVDGADGAEECFHCRCSFLWNAGSLARRVLSVAMLPHTHAHISRVG